jgi:uncharacterized protein
VLVSGSTGLIGSALVPRLEAAGHDVRRLVRSRAQLDSGSFFWDPADGELDQSALDGVEAAVHLSGESVSGRWTAEKKRRIRESRVESTRLLARALAAANPRPRVLVNASAIGVYGDRGDEALDERSDPGSGFLADVTRDWEAATEPASAAGVRVVLLRTGIVLTPAGGALARMLTPFRLGVGGRFGSGRQYMSWISLDDHLGAITHALGAEELAGPVNSTAPNPVRNRELVATLARVLRRPALVPAPGAALRLALGEFANELLSSARVIPRRLLEIGHDFRDPELEPALRRLLGKES